MVCAQCSEAARFVSVGSSLYAVRRNRGEREISGLSALARIFGDVFYATMATGVLMAETFASSRHRSSRVNFHANGLAISS